MLLLGTLALLVVITLALALDYFAGKRWRLVANLLATLTEHAGHMVQSVNAGDSAELARRIGELEASMLTMRRVVTDLDDSVEHRMRKLAARDRRAVAEAQADGAAGDDPRQHTFPGAAFARPMSAGNGAHNPTRQFGASNGRGFGAAR